MAFAENIDHSCHLTGLEYLTNMQTHGQKLGISRIFNKRFHFSQTVFSKNLYHGDKHFASTIEFSKNGDFLACGYNEENRNTKIVVWNMSKVLSNAEDSPAVIKCKDNFEVNCLAFHKSHTILTASKYSSNKNIILYDINTRKELLELEVEDNVTGLSCDPMNDNIFASCSRKCSLWDLRQSGIKPLTFADTTSKFCSIVHHPIKSELLAVANFWSMYLIDVRNPGTYVNKFESSMLTSYGSFDTTGRHLLAVRSRPSVYDLNSFLEIANFEYPEHEFRHAWPNKSGCFVGVDQFVLSGSINNKIYAWKIPIENESLHINYPHFVLKGHHYVVEEIKYNNTYGVIASCSYEKNVKLWSSFQLPFFEEQSNQLIEEES